jgi:hypothetical protein
VNYVELCPEGSFVNADAADPDFFEQQYSRAIISAKQI